MKPRLSRHRGLWYCSGRGVVARDSTPARAFGRWLFLLPMPAL